MWGTSDNSNWWNSFFETEYINGRLQIPKVTHNLVVKTVWAWRVVSYDMYFEK